MSIIPQEMIQETASDSVMLEEDLRLAAIQLRAVSKTRSGRDGRLTKCLADARVTLEHLLRLCARLLPPVLAATADWYDSGVMRTVRARSLSRKTRRHSNDRLDASRRVYVLGVAWAAITKGRLPRRRTDEWHYFVRSSICLADVVSAATEALDELTRVELQMRRRPVS